MIQRNTGYYRDIGIDNIGCVQTTAQPYFQNHHVKLCLLEQPQRRQRTVLEIGQGNITACRFNLRKEAVWADSGNSRPCTRTRSV